MSSIDFFILFAYNKNKQRFIINKGDVDMKIRYNEKRKLLETNVYFKDNNGKRGSRVVRGSSTKDLERNVQKFKDDMNSNSL